MHDRTVLSNDLVGMAADRVLLNNYRAILIGSDDQAIVKVEEEVNGAWVATGGRWYLTSLLEGGINSGLWIDYGQKWGVVGMKDALEAAGKITGLWISDADMEDRLREIEAQYEVPYSMRVKASQNANNLVNEINSKAWFDAYAASLGSFEEELKRETYQAIMDSVTWVGGAN